VLYILTYAYISGGGSIVSQVLYSSTGVKLPHMLTGLMFALSLAFIVWYGTGFVGRITAVLVGGMMLTFLLSIYDLSPTVHIKNLLDTQPDYAPYLLAAVPIYLTSFGYHTNVPSLLKYYGEEPRLIRLCLLYGSLTALLVYLLWIFAALGNIPRSEFTSIISAGGNVGDLIAVLSNVTGNNRLMVLLGAFANLALVSSFLGVTLGLFDFISDKFNFDDSHTGRLKTSLVTFLPPTMGGLLFPDGFLYAIGLAGLSAAVWGVVVPALSAKVSREKFGNPHYRVWGGDGLIYFMFAYAVFLVLCFFLASVNLLPSM